MSTNANSGAQLDPSCPNQIIIHIPPFKNIEKAAKVKFCSKCKLSLKRDKKQLMMKSIATQTESLPPVPPTAPTIPNLPPSPSPTQTQTQTQLPKKIILPSMLLKSASNILLISFLKNFKHGLLHQDRYLPICICIPNFFIQFDILPLPRQSIKWYFDTGFWDSKLFSHTDKYIVTNFKCDFSRIASNTDFSTFDDGDYSLIKIFVISLSLYQKNSAYFATLPPISIDSSYSNFFIIIDNNNQPTLISENIIQCQSTNFANIFCWLGHYYRSETVVNHMRNTTFSTLFDVLFKTESDIFINQVQSNNPSNVIAIYKPVMNALIKTFYGHEIKGFAPTNMLFEHQHPNPEMMQEGFFRALSLSTLSEQPTNEQFLLKSQNLYPWSSTGSFKVTDFMFIEQQFLEKQFLDSIDPGLNFLVDHISTQSDLEIELETNEYKFCSDIEKFYEDNHIFYIFPPLVEQTE